MLGDARRGRVMLVTVAEETPVNESIETASAVETAAGAALAPVVVNAVLDEIVGLDADIDSAEAAAGLRSARWAGQEACVTDLAWRLPLPQIRLPRLLAAELGPAEADRLADALVSGIEDLHERNT